MEKFKFLALIFVFGILPWEGFAEQNQNTNYGKISSTKTIRLGRSTQSNNGNIDRSDEDYLDLEAKEDNCRILPPKPERSKVKHESSVSFESLFEGGFDNMVDAGNHKDVILIMGNTGVGKTVITQIIAGNLSQIHAVKTASGNLVIVDDNEKISAPSVKSRTLVPELVVKTGKGSNQEVAFYDCPGFTDTRGSAQDVAASFFVNQIVSKVKRVKILFLILYSSVQLGHDRTDFDTMVKHATNFVKNITNFKDSIALVATKVKNYDEDGKYKKDRRIQGKIVEFLKAYKRTLENTLREEESKQNDYLGCLEKVEKIKRKVEFVSILLEKDENKKYGKITFSRDPEKCGSLSGSLEVANTSGRIEKMYGALKFSDIGSHTVNFGFSLKPETVLQIKSSYIPNMNKISVEKIGWVIGSFKGWYENGRNLTGNANENGEDLIRACGHNNYTINSLIRQKGTSEGFENFPVSSTVFKNSLKCGFAHIGYVIPDNFTELMERQDQMFDFFQRAIGSNSTLCAVSDWVTPLASLNDKLLKDYLPELNARITTKVNDLVDNFKNWLDNVILEENGNPFKLSTVYLTDMPVDQTKGVFSSILTLNSKKMDKNIFGISSSKFGSVLKNGFQQIGYSVPDNFVYFMKNQDTVFNFFQQVVGTESETRDVNDWINPLYTLRDIIITNYVPEMNQRIAAKVAGLVQNFENWFQSADLKIFTNRYSALLGKYSNRTISEIITLGNNNQLRDFSVNCSEFSKIVEKGFVQIGFLMPTNFSDFMKNKTICLLFSIKL